jgi:hypothetical protein
MEFSCRSDKNSKYYQTNAYDSLKRNNFSDEKESPDLGEERGRTRDRVDQRKIGSPVGPNEADEVDRLEKTGGDDNPPKFGRGLKNERGESSKDDEEREIKKDPQEEDPEKEFSWPVSFLCNKIP